MMNNTDFATKNERRKHAKLANPGDYHAGRRNRAAFAWHGAFGTEVVRVYNDCALGTSAPPRLQKLGAEEYDARVDYDR